MGDRVAVMRKGELQQVRRAADALRPAGQPLRRRLHRLAGDEHGRGDRRARRTASARASSSATRSSSSTTSVPPSHPALARRTRAGTVILGIRPEHLEEASLAPDTPPDRRLRGHGRAARGARLGADGALHASRARAPPRPRRRRSSRATSSGLDGRHRADGRARSSAASGRARTSSEGEPVEVVGRHELAALLRPGDGSRDLRPGRRERSNIVRRRWTRRAAVLAAVVPLAVLAVIEQRLRRDEGSTQRGLGQHHVRRGLDRRRGEGLRRRDQGVQQGQYPGRQGQLQAGRRQPADGASRPRSRAATRPTWPTSPSRASSSSSSTRAR